ncbi:MAG: rhodanese-like domain-containing protein [Pseudomonadota bacterium]
MNTRFSIGAIRWCGLILLSVTLVFFWVKRPPSPDTIRETDGKGRGDSVVSETIDRGQGGTDDETGGLVPVKSIDPSLMVSPAAVIQKLAGKERMILVDIRTPENFNKFKIPGAVNIPLSFLKTKSFLRTAPVVLVNEGYSYGETAAEVALLKEKGVDVKILEGGLRAWKQKGGPIVGDPFAQKDLNKMPAQVFFQEKNLVNWLVVDMGEKRSDESEEIIPRRVQLSPDEKNQKLPGLIQALNTGTTALKAYHQSFKSPDGADLESLVQNTALLFVLILNEKGEGYDLLENSIPEMHREKIFFLEGGLDAYRRFVALHRLATRPKRERVKITGECKSCDEERLKRAAQESDPTR